MAILNLSRDVSLNTYLSRELPPFHAGHGGGIRSFIEYSQGLEQLQAHPDFWSVVAIDIESSEDKYGLDGLELAWEITTAATFKIRPKFLIHSKTSLTYAVEQKMLDSYARHIRFASRLSFPALVSTLLHLADDHAREVNHLNKQRLYLWHRYWKARDICRPGELLSKISFDTKNPTTFVPLSFKESLIVQELALLNKPVNQYGLRCMLNADRFYLEHSQNAPMAVAHITGPISRSTLTFELNSAETKLRAVYDATYGKGSFDLIWKKYRHGHEMRIWFDVWPEIMHMD